jgi:hypothetical protein
MLPLMLARSWAVLLPCLGLMAFPSSFAAGLSVRTDIIFEVILLTAIEQVCVRVRATPTPMTACTHVLPSQV